MKNENEYVYDIEEYSQDVRHYQIKSDVKLTHYEVSNIYRESNDEKDKVKNNLAGCLDWSNERFTDDEILNKIKVIGLFKGTEYGDDCQLDITGEFEND